MKRQPTIQSTATSTGGKVFGLVVGLSLSVLIVAGTIRIVIAMYS